MKFSPIHSLNSSISESKRVSGISEKFIWDSLRSGKPLDDLVQNVPDEFYKWFKTTVKKLQAEYDMIRDSAEQEFNKIKIKKDRARTAEQIKRTQHPHILFRMLDNKDYSDVIWKMVKPKPENVFKKEI